MTAITLPLPSARRLSFGRLVAWAVLAAFIVCSLFPLWITLKTALVPSSTLFDQATLLVPMDVTLDNFRRVLGLAPVNPATPSTPINFALALRNSLIFTLLTVGGQIFFSALAAYAFARIRFVGSTVIFYLFIAATMIPAIVLFIPNFVLIRELGWLNTFQGMVAPTLLMSPFAVFFLRQFFLSTPRELEEAARIDGATPFRTFWSVVLPVHKSAIATLAILLSINAWNDFFWPFLVGRDAEVRVISVALSAFKSQQQSGNPDWTGMTAATVLSIVPVIVLLVLFGRRVVESLQFSGLK
ncbi:carbohydrate ABC transporter permease [Inquilinus sp. Marseille-Q2685]|uniref:carbohydrate ABC transporter permease n=1 Tax=Inquilinus sp. Marseille-Q2685 TaxID=2866581 RepID=UPI001CE44F40|nr:carbohydrate ABC transporter permease [Inquilinus sp. Marseille-Q2685]